MWIITLLVFSAGLRAKRSTGIFFIFMFENGSAEFVWWPTTPLPNEILLNCPNPPLQLLIDSLIILSLIQLCVYADIELDLRFGS